MFGYTIAVKQHAAVSGGKFDQAQRCWASTAYIKIVSKKNCTTNIEAIILDTALDRKGKHAVQTKKKNPLRFGKVPTLVTWHPFGRFHIDLVNCQGGFPFHGRTVHSAKAWYYLFFWFLRVSCKTCQKHYHSNNRFMEAKCQLQRCPPPSFFLICSSNDYEAKFIRRWIH